MASFSFAIDTRHEDRKKSQEDQTNILNQISRNCLKVIMKETAATCNIDALVQVIEQLTIPKRLDFIEVK